MRHLVDTGILLRLFDRPHPDFAVIRAAMTGLMARHEPLFTTHQNIAEFWNVSTRPMLARGGLGLTAQKVAPRVAFIERACSLLSYDSRAHSEWKRPVVIHGITGASVHDARIAAVMLVHRIDSILTLNPQDFKRYTGITVVEPADLVS